MSPNQRLVCRIVGTCLMAVGGALVGLAGAAVSGCQNGALPGNHITFGGCVGDCAAPPSDNKPNN